MAAKKPSYCAIRYNSRKTVCLLFYTAGCTTIWFCSLIQDGKLVCQPLDNFSVPTYCVAIQERCKWKDIDKMAIEKIILSKNEQNQFMIFLLPHWVVTSLANMISKFLEDSHFNINDQQLLIRDILYPKSSKEL